MIERGKVVEVQGDVAVVEMERAETCAHCRCCIAIGDGRMQMKARTLEGVAAGDRVEVEVPVKRLRAVLLVFVLPLAAVLVGALVGKALSDAWYPDGRYANLTAIGGALVLVLPTFAGIYLYERRAGAKTSQPCVIRRLEAAPHDHDVSHP
ncbi:MAG TPA: SoxR reducing system RseC family protein, partial [Planctomycetota bacterium]|nr:SoxR reducing system RseC family protein [Planctomycetota bacterium]